MLSDRRVRRKVRPARIESRGAKEVGVDGSTTIERGPGRRSRLPEWALAATACLVFLGFLGSVDLWGKREQRAAAEAVDTVREGHWLIAQIQSRPRLEKPPLPRWTIAALMAITGRRDEWIVRLPSALAALGMVGLVTALGRRIGGREAGLAAGLALTSSAFFISELRQAGNDGPLAFFATLALYAAWRRLEPEAEGTTSGRRRWALLMSAAIGLGFLTKGPIVLMIVGLTVVPYLAITRALPTGLRKLADPWGMALIAAMVLGWVVPVLLSDPRAWEVWGLEMAQKTGVTGPAHKIHRLPIAADWPMMVAPWVVVAATSLALPFRRGGSTWFPWSWTVANLAAFCLWSVAKPSYYLPCLPGVAILVGLEWVRICRVARSIRAGGHARRILQAHWIIPFVLACVAPVALGQLSPRLLGPCLLGSVAMTTGVIASALAWRRGHDVGALIPIVGAAGVIVAIGYGAVAPKYNDTYSHRALAAEIDRIVPRDAPTILFASELDEGLWSYLRDHRLAPVPGTQPRYNRGFDIAADVRDGTNLIFQPAARARAEKDRLVDAIRDLSSETAYVLIRDKAYAPIAADLAAIARPVLRETDVKRGGLVLLKVEPGPPTVTVGGGVDRIGPSTSRR